jgi:putative sterol carrier protein
VASDSTAEFFDQLRSRGREPLLRNASGSARFELTDGARTQRWLLTIDKGEIDVSRRNAAADCIIRADKASFDRAVVGKLNLLAAALRGEIAVGGDPRLLVVLQRLFPRPSTRKRKRRRSRSAG